MYPYLLTIHSLFRWLLLIALVISIIIAYNGWKRQTAYTLFANRVRHWTATIAHLQLLIGMVIYTQSPIVEIANLHLPPGPTYVHFKQINLIYDSAP